MPDGLGCPITGQAPALQEPLEPTPETSRSHHAAAAGAMSSNGRWRISPASGSLVDEGGSRQDRSEGQVHPLHAGHRAAGRASRIAARVGVHHELLGVRVARKSPVHSRSVVPQTFTTPLTPPAGAAVVVSSTRQVLQWWISPSQVCVSPAAQGPRGQVERACTSSLRCRAGTSAARASRRPPSRPSGRPPPAPGDGWSRRQRASRRGRAARRRSPPRSSSTCGGARLQHDRRRQHRRVPAHLLRVQVGDAGDRVHRLDLHRVAPVRLGLVGIS